MEFTREDWTLFRNMDTLPQKAGVSKCDISKLVAKELTDNALDISDEVEIQGDQLSFTVWNDGEGIDPSKLAELFSINRPLVSSKLLRLPTRGALGNGLRVVVGAVIATGGELYVSTRGYKYKIIPLEDGSSKVEKVEEYHNTGTLIEIYLGGYVINTNWASQAVSFNRGTKYKGKTSAYWYNTETFFELIQASNSTVREVVEEFDGCSSTKAGSIAKLYGKNKKSKELSFSESEKLLEEIRNQSKPVKASRLGGIGDVEEYSGYNLQQGTFVIESTKGKHQAEIPFTVEVYTREANTPFCNVLINKSPSIKTVYVNGINKKLNIWSGALDFDLKSKNVEIIININTPYMPITSDGKEPDYRLMKEVIETATVKAVNSHKRNIKIQLGEDNAKRVTQKDIILDKLDEAVKKASGDGQYRFSQRQLFYVVRPYIMEQLGTEPTYENFNKVITDYEVEFRDIKGMYRDTRGSLYTPHSGDTIPIGTLTVEQYERPEWTFNKVLYIEKEGFFEILKDAKFPERYDCALLTSKGYASRAVKDLIDLLGESEEELQVFCVHDCDKAGTMIYQTLQEETRARGKRKVNIIDIGLNPKEAIAMELDAEKIDINKNAVADYIEPIYANWLQKNRVELNAMTTPQFIEWLGNKMKEHGSSKVIPLEEVLKNELSHKVTHLTKSKVRDRILKENEYEKQCQQEVISLQGKIEEKGTKLKDIVAQSLEARPEQIWKQPIEIIAKEIV